MGGNVSTEEQNFQELLNSKEMTVLVFSRKIKIQSSVSPLRIRTFISTSEPQESELTSSDVSSAERLD